MGREALPGGAPESLTQQRADIVVFACGDPAHGEQDSIAITACTGLPAEMLERIDIKLVGPVRPEYMRDLALGTHVVIADTVVGPPGDIVEIAVIELVGREEELFINSTPNQSLDEVVAMAQLLRDRPLRGRFVGIGVEGEDYRAKPDPAAVETLRTAVAAAIEELVAS